MADYNDMTPNQIADHLAKLISKPLPRKLPKKPKRKPKGKKTKFKAPPATPIPDTVTLTLLGTHRINGYPYGPGTVTVPYKLALVLQESDQRARKYDDNWRQPKAIIIGSRGESGHKQTTVSPGMLESPTLNVPEAGFAHSDGQFTNF